MERLSIDRYRDLISSCTRCDKRAGCNTLRAPRFGLGRRTTKRARCRLMLVGQNPPTDPLRSKHGAWMLGYPNTDLGAHEHLVWALLEYLDLKHEEVWATQAVKCPTPGNVPPSPDAIRACLPHLTNELRDVDPEVILGFGQWTEFAVHEAVSHRILTPWTQLLVQPVGRAVEQHVRVHDYFVFAPHPSTVVRFLDRQSWIDQIKAGIELARRSRA